MAGRVASQRPARLLSTDRNVRSGCGGDSGPGDTVGGELVEGVQSRRRVRGAGTSARSRRPHLRPPGCGAGLQIRGHHLGLAVLDHKGDHRDAIGPRPALEIAAELVPDRLEQRRGHDWPAPVIVEVDRPAGLSAAHSHAVEIQPVQAGDI
jgi:hypothetical protein